MVASQAAGNDRGNAAKRVPAAYVEVLTVSALADFDGQPDRRATPLVSGRARTEDDPPVVAVPTATMNRRADTTTTSAAAPSPLRREAPTGVMQKP